MLSPPTVYEQPDRDPGLQLFKSGYFHYSWIGAGGGHFSYWGGEAHSIVDGNFPYKGALKMLSVPKGSTWQVSVSDIPNDRAAAPVEHNFSGSNLFRMRRPPAPKPVSDRAAALERQMLPRQLSNSRRSAANRPA